MNENQQLRHTAVDLAMRFARDNNLCLTTDRMLEEAAKIEAFLRNGVADK